MQDVLLPDPGCTQIGGGVPMAAYSEWSPCRIKATYVRTYVRSVKHIRKKNEPFFNLWVVVVGKYVVWWEDKIGKKNDVPQETLMLLLLGIDSVCATARRPAGC